MTTLIDAPPSDADGLLPSKKKSGGGGLGQYILIRFLLIFPTIFILVTMVFFLMRITGDPITAAMGGRLPPDQLQERIHAAGYDRPILVQYFEYLGAARHRATSAPRSRTTAGCRDAGHLRFGHAGTDHQRPDRRAARRYSAGHGCGSPPRPCPRCGAACLRHPLLRHPGVLCGAAAQAHFFGVAWLASGGGTCQDVQRTGPHGAAGANRDLLAGCGPQREHGRAGRRHGTCGPACGRPGAADGRNLPPARPDQRDRHPRQGLHRGRTVARASANTVSSPSTPTSPP